MTVYFRALTIAAALITTTTSALASNYLCNYTARISEEDKYNSQGKYLGNGYTNTAVANILRQDRANFYVYSAYTNSEDERDCAFADKNARATMQRFLSAGSIPTYAKRAIIDNNPLLSVDVYDDHVDIEIIEMDDAPTQSRIR